MNSSLDKLRIDKWLWHARFFKSRSLAAAAVETGIRVDGTKVSKPSRTVSPGDTLTFTQARRVRVIRVVAIGNRRGPAAEAQALYEDLTPPEERSEKPGDVGTPVPKYDKGGRPTKKDRKQLNKSGPHLLD